MPKQLADLAWPVRTERLALRPPCRDDEPAVFAYRCDPQVAEWLTGLDDDPGAFGVKFADADWLGRTLVIEREGAVIGDVMVRIEDGWTQAEVAEHGKAIAAEIGWVLAPWATGEGLATEAVRETLRICFDELALRRVVAICFADNERSWRLMERVGMRREAHSIADGLHRTKGWLDSYTYALLAEEWRQGAPRGPTPDFLY